MAERPRSKSRQARGQAAYKAGLWAERLALIFLTLKLYKILGHRVQTRTGEVDILAAQGRTLVIVEVKARTTLAQAAEALRPKQQARLARAGEILLARHPDMETLRFDVIEIAPRRWPRHIKAAWTL